MSESSSAPTTVEQRRSSRTLAKAIFDSDLPEQFVRTIPAQSLHLAVRQAGLTDCLDLLGIVSLEQCRLLLDFDIWEQDRICEDRLWEWLSLTDDEGDFELLHKVLKAIDLKVVGLLVSRYVEVVTFDEPNDQPPGEGFYTPDKGLTWIHLKIPDTSRHFLLARFLALIFETSAELFYQILAIPGVATLSGLEEESFQDRTRRLAAEGVPDSEHAASLLAGLPPALAMQDLKATAKRKPVEGIRAVEPLVYDTPNGGALKELLEGVGETLEEELTLVLNAAVVHFKVDYAERDAMLTLIDQVKGAVVIGIEAAKRAVPDTTTISAYRALGIARLFGLGFYQLADLRKSARRYGNEEIQALNTEGALFGILAGLREHFPKMPCFVLQNGALETANGKLTPGYRAFQSLHEVTILAKLLRSLSEAGGATSASD